jgi:hypothetical protein
MTKLEIFLGCLVTVLGAVVSIAGVTYAPGIPGFVLGFAGIFGIAWTWRRLITGS